MKVAFGSSPRSNDLSLIDDIPWPLFLASINTHRRARVSEAEYWALSKNDRHAAKEGSYFLAADFSSKIRKEAYMLSMSAFVCDLDTGNLSAGDIEAKLLGTEFVAYTSFSSRPSDKRWRVVVPYKDQIRVTQHAAAYDYFRGLLGDVLAPECAKPCQLWYLPACPSDANPEFIHRSGRFFDASNFQDVATQPKTPVAANLGSLSELSEVLNAISIDFWPPGDKYERHFIPILAAIHHESRGSKEGLEIFTAWARKGVDFTSEEDIHRKWGSLRLDHANPTTLGTLIMFAKEQNPEFRKPLPLPPAVQDPNDWDSSMAWMDENFAYVTQQDKVWRFGPNNFSHWYALHQQLANKKVVCGVNEKTGEKKYMPLSKAWQESSSRVDRHAVNYRPGQPRITDKNEVNIWEGWGADPVEGNVEPWHRLMEHIFAADLEARVWFEQWLAYPIQNPGTKLYQACVFWSRTQGTGKTLTAEIVKRIYGKNSCTVNATELHGSFNSWAAKRQFVLGEENSSEHARVDNEKLKAKITQLTCNINEKHQPVYEIDDCINYFFTSNKPNAFSIELTDRRYFVWHLPEVKPSREFFDDIDTWYKDPKGPAALHAYLKRLDISTFKPTGDAYDTKAKDQMKGLTMSPLQEWLKGYVEQDIDKPAGTPEITSTATLSISYLVANNKSTTPNAVHKALNELGLLSMRIVTAHGKQRRLVAVSRPTYWDAQPNSAWATEVEKNDIGTLR